MKVLITGGSGIIGSVLRHGLPKISEIIAIDRVPQNGVITLDLLDQGNRAHVDTLLAEIDAVVHLAWDTRENGSSTDGIPGNKEMAEVMLARSLERGVRQFILASSVHVSFGQIGYRPGDIVEKHETLHHLRINAGDPVSPISAYGSSKFYLEKRGQVYAEKGMEVVVIRFGNVTQDNNPGEYPFWLSQRDCSQFVDRCLNAALPAYSVFYAISNNACNPFDLESAQQKLGYQPSDGQPCPFGL